MTPSNIKCRSSTDDKLALLQIIKGKKDILFGRFSTELENQNKIASWEEVLVKAKSLQMVTANRDYIWIRDKLWGQWKSRVLKKRDNAKKTGTAGGRNRMMDDVDNMIINIIGDDSPTVDGIAGVESGRPEASQVLSCEIDNVIGGSAERISDDDELVVEIPNEVANKEKTSSKRKKHLLDSELMDKKQKLQISVLELEQYKLQLQTFKLEQELHLEHSSLTQSILDKVLY